MNMYVRVAFNGEILSLREEGLQCHGNVLINVCVLLVFIVIIFFS